MDNDNENDRSTGYTNIRIYMNAILLQLFPGPVKIDHYNLIDGIDDFDVDPSTATVSTGNTSDITPYDSIDIKSNISKTAATRTAVKAPFYLDIYNLSNMGLIVSYFAIGTSNYQHYYHYHHHNYHHNYRYCDTTDNNTCRLLSY